jgi:hypothetical protein
MRGCGIGFNVVDAGAGAGSLIGSPAIEMVEIMFGLERMRQFQPTHRAPQGRRR